MSSAGVRTLSRRRSSRKRCEGVLRSWHLHLYEAVDGLHWVLYGTEQDAPGGTQAVFSRASGTLPAHLVGDPQRDVLEVLGAELFNLAPLLDD